MTLRTDRMHAGKHHFWKHVAQRMAPLMFALSLTFLVCQAILVVLWVDVPNFSENAIRAIDPDSPRAMQMRALLGADQSNPWIQTSTILLMLVIWPLVIAEACMHWLTRPWNAETRKDHFFTFLICLCPSLRMCARSFEMHHRLWLPGLGWRQANKRLRKRLERRFSVPMIVIAMMIMPVLVIEFFMKTQVAEYAWLRLSLHVSTGVIWFAFAAEFILMVSVADKKLAYCRAHWIDIAIILLPLFSFLRSLRILRATQAANALRLPQITKMARIYRLRGTAVKAIRALVLIDFIQRLMHSDVERSIGRLQRQLEEVEAEAKEIRRKIVRLEKRRLREEAETAADRGNPEATASDSLQARIASK